MSRRASRTRHDLTEAPQQIRTEESKYGYVNGPSTDTTNNVRTYEHNYYYTRRPTRRRRRRTDDDDDYDDDDDDGTSLRSFTFTFRFVYVRYVRTYGNVGKVPGNVRYGYLPVTVPVTGTLTGYLPG